MASLDYNGLGVHVKVASIEESRRFYEGTLGLKPVFAYGDEAFLATLPPGVPTATERYHGVTYEPIPNCPLEIADGHIAVKDAAVFSDPILSPKVSAMLRVQSFVPLLEAGLRPKFPVRHYYWNTLEIALRDPDGWVIILVAPFSEGERAAIERFVPVEDVAPA